MSDSDTNGAPKGESGPKRSETAYPYYGLGRGVEVVQAIRRAGGNEASNAEVMREMGVPKTTDRAWAYGIPAAIQFGLVERSGRGEDGRLKITPLALRIALPSSAEEARIARVEAFKRPDLYGRLLDRYTGHPVPAKEGLKNLLHREFGIVESMAPNAADAFLDSLKEAELVAPSGLVTSGIAAGPTEPTTPNNPSTQPNQESQLVAVPRDFVLYKCKIGRAEFIDLPLPKNLTRSQVARIKKFLDTQVDDPEEDGASEESAEV